MALILYDIAVPAGNQPVTTAEYIKFEDQETLQYKFDNGSFGGEPDEAIPNADIDSSIASVFEN